jgi:hypothetical protein
MIPKIGGRISEEIMRRSVWRYSGFGRGASAARTLSISRAH